MVGLRDLVLLFTMFTMLSKVPVSFEFGLLQQKSNINGSASTFIQLHFFKVKQILVSIIILLLYLKYFFQDQLYEYLNEELDRLSEGKVMIEDASKLSVVAALLNAISETNERIVLVSYFTQARTHTHTLIQCSFERSLNHKLKYRYSKL